MRLLRVHGLALVALLGLAPGCTLGKVTLTSESPDGSARVEIFDPGGVLKIDRNFEIYLESPIGSPRRRIFRSPDEGPPGYETIVWSRDSQRFVLLGKTFVAHRRRLPNGDQLYLLYDRPTGKAWCNARQQRELPAFSLDDLDDREWVQSIGAEPSQVAINFRYWLNSMGAGGWTRVNADVENLGTVADDYRVVVDAADSWFEADPEAIHLEPGASALLKVHCRIPRSACAGPRDVTVRVESSTNEADRTWASFRLVVQRSGPPPPGC